MVQLKKVVYASKIAAVAGTVLVLGFFMAGMTQIAESVVEVEHTVDIVLKHKEILEKGMLKSPTYTLP